ncbi:IPExxxVDY family protein [Flexithrix dorotheae]|uniref:IPExxxVDY family protein n=1 Tax=Flexithrix dorotheae TaxID=70993 RepID=UPI0003A3FCA4|nr:IPExxxVDY family protein [Flexithrix dorotheae]
MSITIVSVDQNANPVGTMPHKLQVSYNFDFDLFGIVSVQKGYKMAWLLNKFLGISLVKNENFRMESNEHKRFEIPNYIFKTENNTYRLICNKSAAYKYAQKYSIAPELQNIDYFLLIENQTGLISPDKILNVIQDLSEVQYVCSIDLETLKSRENFLF